MQEQLNSIQLQLWIVIVLFAVFAIANVLNYLCLRKKNQAESDEPKFSLMFDMDQIDELIEKSTKHLQIYPNHIDALYFGAKALIVKKQFSEAKKLLERLATLDPTISETIQDMLELCIKNEAS